MDTRVRLIGLWCPNDHANKLFLLGLNFNSSNDLNTPFFACFLREARKSKSAVATEKNVKKEKWLNTNWKFEIR